MRTNLRAPRPVVLSRRLALLVATIALCASASGCAARSATSHPGALEHPGEPIVRSGGQSVSGNPYAQLRLEVLDRLDGAPVSGAFADLWRGPVADTASDAQPRRARPVSEGQTKPSGEIATWYVVRFDSLAAGRYTVRVRRIGYETEYWHVEVRPGCEATLRLRLWRAGMCLADCVQPSLEPRVRAAELFTCSGR